METMLLLAMSDVRAFGDWRQIGAQHCPGLHPCRAAGSRVLQELHDCKDTADIESKIYILQVSWRQDAAPSSSPPAQPSPYCLAQ